MAEEQGAEEQRADEKAAKRPRRRQSQPGRPRQRGAPVPRRKPARWDPRRWPPLLRSIALAALPLVAGGVTAALVVLFATGGGGSADQNQVRDLAETSIEILPTRDWARLYGLYNKEYQQRCDRAAFDQLWEQAAQNLGSDLPNYKVKAVRDITVQGDRASASVVTALREQESRFRYEFVREEGAWKFAPAAGTSGCDAFLREPSAATTPPPATPPPAATPPPPTP